MSDENQKENVEQRDVVAHLHKTGTLSNANFPKDAEGRVYHLGVKRGEVANRILSVGDPKRAQTISNLLDNPQTCFVRASNRGFVIYTGTYHNVPLSIIATGMGFPMMDFVVRETRAIVDGPMVMMRLGTCGALKESITLGTVLIASKGAVLVTRDPDAFGSEDSTVLPYRFSRPIGADQGLSDELAKKLQSAGVMTADVMNATADTFYASQGRKDDNFGDRNDSLISNLMGQYPDIGCLEMESFHLLDMARCSRGTISATACAIAIAQRTTNAFLDNDNIRRLEKLAGEAALATLAEHPLSSTMQTDECVWNEMVKH